MIPEEIVAATAAVTGVPVAAITGRRRQRQVCEARFLAIAAVRRAFHWWTLQQTGEFFGRDHGSVISACRRHADLLATEPHYARWWSQINHDIATS